MYKVLSARLNFPHWYCWRFTSSLMQCCIIHYILKDRNTFIFRVKRSKNSSCSGKKGCTYYRCLWWRDWKGKVYATLGLTWHPACCDYTLINWLVSHQETQLYVYVTISYIYMSLLADHQALYENYKNEYNYKQCMYTHHMRSHIFIICENCIQRCLINFCSLVYCFFFLLRPTTINRLKYI